MNSKEYYVNCIYEMADSISNIEWLMKIYSFVKVFADDKEGAV